MSGFGTRWCAICDARCDTLDDVCSDACQRELDRISDEPMRERVLWIVRPWDSDALSWRTDVKVRLL